MMRRRGNFLAHQRRRISLISITFPDGLLDRGDFSGGRRRRLGRQPIGVTRHPHRVFMDGTPPTGRTVAYPGASFTCDKIRSEHVYLDRQTVAERLGLKASEPEAQSTGFTPRKANLYLTFGIL